VARKTILVFAPRVSSAHAMILDPVAPKSQSQWSNAGVLSMLPVPLATLAALSMS
jgi:hypothetical protein